MQPSNDNKRVTTSRGERAGRSGYLHIAPKTNVNENSEWMVSIVRIILVSSIDEGKGRGKLVDYSPSTPPILAESTYWYADEEDSTAALASRIAGKRPSKETLSP